MCEAMWRLVSTPRNGYLLARVESGIFIDEGNLGFVRETAYAPGAFAVAFVPDQIKGMPGPKVYELFGWVLYPVALRT